MFFMTRSVPGMTIRWNRHPSDFVPFLSFLIVLLCSRICYGQKTSKDTNATANLPPGTDLDRCNGVYLAYNFISRVKEYPRVKNVSAQAWAFKSAATILNTGDEEVKAWKMHIGFHNKEILVSAEGATLLDAGDFPADVGNGTTLGGNPQQDLKTSIDTAGDLEQIQVRIQMKGTQFGLKPGEIPMPKTIRLDNDGFKCPKPSVRGSRNMYVCCAKDPKAKAKKIENVKFSRRQHGHLTMTYDVLQAYTNNYLAQVTIENNHPLGRLDHWNLTWDWQKDEFIGSMKGAYARAKNPSSCVYGPAGKHYRDMDFSKVSTCDKKPIISDLPVERKEDNETGKIPYCCRNGSLLPVTMDKEKSKSVFQLQVFKLPPDDNRSALTPPTKWNISGIITPDYKCTAPIRVDPTEFPDPTGLQSTVTAVASWQVVCNITRPKPKQSRCCVSFSAFYNESIVPCPTCACGCPDRFSCNPDAQGLLLPPEAILVPFANRTTKAKAWAKIKRFNVPHKLPCPDNCGVSINWHVASDFNGGWTARMTLFNWIETPFDYWFAALQFNKATPGYQTVYSFNGTKLKSPFIKDTIFFQGLKGQTMLIPIKNGSRDSDPRVPGKQQSVIAFGKRGVHNFDIKRDAFPSKVFFNGEECALPPHFPIPGAGNSPQISVLTAIFIVMLSLTLLTDPFNH